MFRYLVKTIRSWWFDRRVKKAIKQNRLGELGLFDNLLNSDGVFKIKIAQRGGPPVCCDEAGKARRVKSVQEYMEENKCCGKTYTHTKDGKVKAE